MSYDAIFRAQGVLVTLLADLPAAVATVAAEQAQTVKAPGTVYTRTLGTWPLGDDRPVEIKGPQGPLDGNAQSTINELSYWVTVSGVDADRDHLDIELKCYLTALVRVLDNKGAPDGRWACYCGRVDYLPPVERPEEPFIGGIGAEVTVKIAATR